MDDLDVLARDFGLGARGKSNPMRSAPSDRRSIDDPLFGDVFSGQPKHAASSNPSSKNSHSSVNDFDYESIFKSSAASELKNGNNSSSKSSSLPVYDKPVYDEDIFDGLPGLKSKSAATAVRFEDDMFSTISLPPTSKSRNQSSDFDDLLGNLGRNEKGGESNMSSSAKSSSSTKGFDDLLPGFGSGSPAASNRPVPESRWGSVPTAGSKHGNMLDDPFVVLESDSTPHSSSGVFTDPLEEIGKLSKSRSVRAEVSSGTGGAFDDLDPLGTSGKSAHVLSPGRDRIGKGGSPSRSEMPQSSTGREQMGTSTFRYSESSTAKKDPVDNFQESPLFDVPNVSTDSQKSFDQTASPQYYGTGPQVDMSQASEQGHQNDDVWLTVSEIPLFTQPTAAPPPSRPPPPIPRKSSKSETGSYFSSSRKKGDEFSSPSYNSHHSQSSKPDWSADKSPPASQFDELDDFATGNNSQEREYKEMQERLERERKQGEEEIEMKRLERERLREIERVKARQAVERANREARERAAADARLKAERAAVEKANAEARERAGRVAVQRVQAEARERAAAEARERAEKAAAEAREKETRDRAAVARAEAEARRRAERAAVERAAAEARGRAAAEARERAAAAAASKMNEQKNDNDLESFFSMGRASSAPRDRTNSTVSVSTVTVIYVHKIALFSPAVADFYGPDPFSDQFQNKGGSEAAKRTPPSSGATSNMKKASSSTNFEVEGETEERRRARLDRHQRTQERAAKALAEKNQRDLQAQREQEERHRIAETLDIEIKRWAAGKEGNLRALLSTLQYVLWPECGWQPVSLTDLITGASVKKVYRKATLCIHPDKVQQKGATLQQKYIAEKVFDLLKEAWNKFNSEELF
ncbi:chaperone DnaJ-domain superfamily protein [Striga asiatica]|uniref:Chaperone DnaJ-domain superfamily protein n=1 Tax=Striga asiatica TaxID=4170 RepID=A0A5A7P5E8_STRAF|nr:chaperone DnaJ-domain superfamily protein [Striga asiatica]